MLQLVKLIGSSFIVGFSHILGFPYHHNLIFWHGRILLTHAYNSANIIDISAINDIQVKILFIGGEGIFNNSFLKAVNIISLLTM